MSLTLSDVENQVWGKLRESSSDTHFGQPALDLLINESIRFLATLIEYPRRTTSVQVSEGTPTYPIPSDFILLRYAAFGDETLTGDVRPLRIVTEDTVREMFPNYKDATARTEGRPVYIYLLDRGNFAILPRASAAESAAGKKLYYEYVYSPAALSNSSDPVDLPAPYADLVQFYVLHLCHLTLQNKDMADTALNELMAKVKLIKPAVVKETREALAFMFGNDIDVDVTGSFNVIP